MIDSKETKQLETALESFRDYISSNYGSDTEISNRYLQVALRLQHYAAESPLPFDDTLKGFYLLLTGMPAFERPQESKKHSARAILMLNDLFYGREPKLRYLYDRIECPVPFKGVIASYQELMAGDMKKEGTIRTRIGRMKVFFAYLAEHGCISLESFTGEMMAAFVASLDGKYSSQGKASILYTVRNFFSYEMFLRQITFDPKLYLTGLHSKKHERLASFYTADEVRRIMNAVDRNTAWGKTIYLMMLLACVYGMRSSDIKRLRLNDINWPKQSIVVTQYKTRRSVTLPLTEEVTYALLDYLKNVRPAAAYNHVFVRMRPPHQPYSMNDHFGDKLSIYFEKAGVCTDGKHHGLHSMRHSLAANLLAGGVPVNEISVILGHSSVAATKTYVWSDIEHLRDAALEVPCHD